MRLIADETILYHSPDPANLYCYTPALAEGFSGRIFASFDIAGPGLAGESGPKSDRGDYGSNQLRVFYSDDAGYRWQESKSRLAMRHARVFKAGSALYVLGHAGKLLISRSFDNGETWCDPVVLDDANSWHQSAGSIDFANGKIYLTMEQVPVASGGYYGNPLLFSAFIDADLTKRENWRISQPALFADQLAHSQPPAGKVPHSWLESSVAFERDENSIFYDPEFRSLLVFLRLHRCEYPNVAAVLRGRENADGTLSLEPLEKPDGTRIAYVPFPGGRMKFQFFWDEPSRLYWLITTQNVLATFTRPEALSREVFHFDERNRLELFYSRNLFDWCSAGLVAARKESRESRHYASLLPVGDTLLVLSRSGDEQTKNSHDTDMITLHRVENFRSLAF